jgi:transcriptional regulator with XRE-family HTH domain
MHVRSFYRQRRGTRTLAEASEATGISRGTLSRIERGEQFPKAEQVISLVGFYDPDTAHIFKGSPPGRYFFSRLYPNSVLRCLQLERNCVDCGKALPPESRANRRRHVRGECA